MPDKLLSPLTVAPFDDWTYEDAQKALKEQLIEDYQTREAYAEGDHFQNGKEWVGPGDSKANDKIEEQFAPEDAIGEVLSNISNAFGEPQIGAAPINEAEANEKLVDELISLLSNWWDKQKIQEHIQERQKTGAWAGYAAMRLWIPWRFLLKDEDGEITVRDTDDLAQALSYIHVSSPKPDAGAILTDPGTQDKVAVYFDKEVEHNANGEPITHERVELVYLDPDRETDEEAETIMRIVYADPEKKRSLRTTLPLKGNILFSEIRTRPVITEAVMRTQRQLNLLTTLITRMAETAAFRERYTKNAKPQGLRIPYSEGDNLQDGAFLERDEEGRLWQVVPQKRTLGANTTTELVGLPQYDDRGDAKGHHTPDVEIVDPVDPGPYNLAADATRRRILRMCGQGHLGGISNAESSGIAYEQARAVFEKDLNKRRVSEEGMLRDILTTVISMAEHFTGKKGYFTDKLRLTVDQHVNAGPRSPDLVRLDLESYEAGVISRETAMSLIGVEDIDAENIRVQQSATHILNILQKVVDATKDNFDPETVINLLDELNIPEEIINALVIKEPEPVPPALEGEGEEPFGEEEEPEGEDE